MEKGPRRNKPQLIQSRSRPIIYECHGMTMYSGYKRKLVGDNMHLHVDVVGLVSAWMLSACAIRGLSVEWLCLRSLNGMNISNGMMVMPSGKMVMPFGTIGYAFGFGL